MKKKCKVVLVPHNEPIDEWQGSILVRSDVGMAPWNKSMVEHPKPYVRSSLIRTWSRWGNPHHLYIISDDEIKVGDWYLYQHESDSDQWVLFQAPAKPNTELIRQFGNASTAKVIASTHPTLGLPAIPEDFIKEYCAAEEKPQEVMVTEVTIVGTMIDPGQGHHYGFPKLYCGQNPAHSEVRTFLAENGFPMKEFDGMYRTWEVAVKTIEISKVKETWTRDEIEFALMQCCNPKIVKDVFRHLYTVEEDMKEFEKER